MLTRISLIQSEFLRWRVWDTAIFCLTDKEVNGNHSQMMMLSVSTL